MPTPERRGSAAVAAAPATAGSSADGAAGGGGTLERLKGLKEGFGAVEQQMGQREAQLQAVLDKLEKAQSDLAKAKADGAGGGAGGGAAASGDEAFSA